MPFLRLGKAVIVLAVVCAAIWYYPPARLTAYVVLGRSPACPWRQAVRAQANEKEQIAIKDRILAASKLLENDQKGYHLWLTPAGRYWIPQGSTYVLPFNLAEQARHIYFTEGHSVNPGDVVFDCGANVGVFVRESLNRGARLVVAIEPAPENVECLRRNFEAEIRDGRVILCPKGVWNKEDTLELHIDPENSAADSFLIQHPGARKSVRVPLTTIDRLVAEYKLDRVSFIKMDIEGAEPNALEGARDTIARFRPRMSISAYHAPDHAKRIPELVRQASSGYRVECGPCAEAGYGVRPDIQFFRPQ